MIMRDLDSPHASLAYILSRDGTILEVVRAIGAYTDSAGMADPPSLPILGSHSDSPLWNPERMRKPPGVGQPFSLLIDRGSLDKYIRFLAEIRETGAALCWELNVSLGIRPYTLTFSGGRTGDLILVVGADTDNGMLGLIDDLVKMSNEQSTEIRALMKEQFDMLRRTSACLDPFDKAEPRNNELIFDEVTKLNNELVATQRELSKANSELERVNTELRRLDGLKNRFLGMAAHDLRSPLGAIMNYTEFLIDETEGSLSAEHRDFLNIIHESSEFMLGLVNDLLDVATIESGKLMLDLAKVDIRQVIRQTVAIHSVLAAKKSITINVCTEAVPIILADGPKLSQVFGNLISNAVKFSHPGSSVNLDVRPSPIATTDIGESGAGDSRSGSGGVIVIVKDSGLGIPAEELGKLFAPFGRTVVRSTSGEKNSGLGLAIARRIVEGHGGTIFVRSEVGKGTEFTVFFPLSIPTGSSQ